MFIYVSVCFLFVLALGAFFVRLGILCRIKYFLFFYCNYRKLVLPYMIACYYGRAYVTTRQKEVLWYSESTLTAIT